MKRKILMSSGAILLIVGFFAIRFFSAMNRAVEFAQEQETVGRAFMDGMDEQEFTEALDFSRELMSELGLSAESGWRVLKDSNGKRLPAKWAERGVIFIRYDKDRVSFSWHGGPHAHTHLTVARQEDGGYRFTAYYSDHEPSRMLRVIPKAELNQ